jgi:phosphopantothenoylcysteine decarboxylase/phosphopantothenate--cysteine ligase
MEPVVDRRFLGKRLVLGVTGSIAAYKAVSLLRTLIKEGADVTVVMTAAATRFVASLTFEVLSGRPVAEDLFAAHQEMLHLTLAEQADAVVIAPATANVLAKCATGLADDLLSTLLLATRAPVILAPAMDGGMWEHPAVQANVQGLRARGVVVLDPEVGPLASGRTGLGRLPGEAAIIAALAARLAPRRDLVGQRVLVSAGPTQEALDPVRYISNRSSGKMGYAVAQAARERGAQVILVTGPTALSPLAGVEVVPVTTAEEMTKALTGRLDWCTLVVMAAAVADFRPVETRRQKVKKTDGNWQTLRLEPTDDILQQLCSRRTSQIVVGFAAETESVTDHAREKLARKGLDLIVGNDVSLPGSGFGTDTNQAVLVDRNGRVVDLPLMSKRELADRILDAAMALGAAGGSPRRPRSAEKER